jgi:seryl-tRNA synthetase
MNKLKSDNERLQKQQDDLTKQLSDTSSDETSLKIQIATLQNRVAELEQEKQDIAEKERKITSELEASISNFGSASEQLRDLLRRNEEISLEKTTVLKERDGARSAVERGVKIGIELCEEAEHYSRQLFEEEMHLLLEDLEQYMIDTLPVWSQQQLQLRGNNNNNLISLKKSISDCVSSDLLKHVYIYFNNII